MSKRRRKKLTPEEQLEFEKKELRKDIKQIFKDAGFERIPTTVPKKRKNNLIHIEINGARTDIDNLFMYENIIVICEETAGRDKNKAHLRKKCDFFDALLKAGKQELIDLFCETYQSFEEAVKTRDYTSDRYIFKCMYVSQYPVDASAHKRNPQVAFLSRSELRYFVRLSKAIKLSSRYEIFKLLGIELSDVGDLSSQGTSSDLVSLVLPRETHMFKHCDYVVTFLAKPSLLLGLSYVLRRHGWRDSDYLYQRLLVPKKMRRIRRFIAEGHGVFVNNIIVSLPEDTIIRDSDGNKVSQSGIDLKHSYTMVIPEKMESIGVIDGQHRVLAYHEGHSSDAYERSVAKLRKKQHLLVTGLVYKKGISEDEKRRFEAGLFLDINSKQDPVKAALRQDIEAILDPNSRTAISKSIVRILNSEGVLSGLLEENPLQVGKFVRTASLIKHGLNPAISDQVNDTLWAVWPDKKSKDSLKTMSQIRLREYSSFCASEIERLISAFKEGHEEMWDLENEESQMLTATTLTGLMHFLRRVIAAGESRTHDDYLRYFGKLDYSEFSKGRFRFKSSNWKGLGEWIFVSAFGTTPQGSQEPSISQL